MILIASVDQYMISSYSENAVRANILGIISTWTVAVGLAYLPGIKANLGLVGLWIGMALDEVIRAIIFIIRWKKGGGRKSGL